MKYLNIVITTILFSILPILGEINLNDNVTLSGLIESRILNTDVDNVSTDKNETDVEFGITAKKDKAIIFANLIYRDSVLSLEEGYITVGDKYYLRAGKMFIPFGKRDDLTNFIAYPLTKTVNQYADNTALIGTKLSLGDIKAYTFKNATDSTTNQYGLSLDNTYGKLSYGVGWVSDVTTVSSVKTLAGIDTYAVIQLNNRTSLYGEYIDILDNSTTYTYNVELSTDIKQITATLKYERSRDLALSPEKIYGINIRYNISDDCNIGIEYLDNTYVNTSLDSNAINAELSVVF